MEYKILVADDDKEIREAIEIYLTNETNESPYSLPMPSVSCRVYTVKEIDSTVHCLQYIRRSPYTHKIRRLILRKISDYSIQNPVHFFMALSHCQTSDGITIQIKFCNLLRVSNPDIFINTTLINSEKHLMRIDCIRQRIQPGHLVFAAGPASASSAPQNRHILFTPPHWRDTHQMPWQ